jgi:hypothetical protein
MIRIDRRDRIRHSGLDLESHDVAEMLLSLGWHGILNQVQDDGGETACAASLRSGRFTLHELLCKGSAA